MIYEVYDVETLINVFTYTGFECSSKEYHQFVISRWRNDLDKLYTYLTKEEMLDGIQIGFNNIDFDYHIIHYILVNYESLACMTGQEIAQLLHQQAQNLINSKPEYISDKDVIIKQLDLYKIWHYNNEARRTSLKDLEIAMRMENVEEMPFAHDHWCSKDDIGMILAYNKNDVEATYKFLLATLGRTDYPLYKGEDKLALRVDINNKFGVNVLNLPDVRMGEELLLTLYCRATNQNKYEVKKLRTNRDSVNLNDCIPSWCDVKDKYFLKFINILKKTTVTFPTNNKFEFSVINPEIGYKWDFGLGGCHGCIAPGIYTPKSNEKILDLDVSSLYPSIAKSLKLYPEHLGKIFNTIYGGFVDERIKEKHKPKDVRDNVLIKAFKLVLNGAYGKSKDENSFLYDPLYALRTTIAGQIFICMWSERMIEACPSIKFLQTNTDGITMIIPDDKLEDIRKVNTQLTELTGLCIDEAFYKKMIIRDVNNYAAVYNDYTPENDHLKLKGDFEIYKEYHKDCSMQIVPYAVKKYLIEGIPVGETIRKHTNIFDFCLRLKTNSLSKGLFTHFDGPNIVTDKLPRTTRYYIGTGLEAGSLTKQFNDKSMSVNSGYSAILFNKYEKKDMKDYNIDYSFYITEANKLIQSVKNTQMSLF